MDANLLVALVAPRPLLAGDVATAAHVSGRLCGIFDGCWWVAAREGNAISLRGVFCKLLEGMVGTSGFEPLTSTVSR
jgi:hypothetical protein